MNESFHSATDEDPLESLRSSVHEFSGSFHSALSTSDIDKKIDAISNWVEEQKKEADEEARKKIIQSMGNVATSTISGLEKMESGDVLGGTLEIISSVVALAGEAAGGPVWATVGGTICSVIGAILASRKPRQPSIVEQVADVVHKEFVEFNSKLQDQKFDGLKRRVSDQTAQLQKMKPGEKLKDPDLWNDYVEFMGKLSNTIQSPLPYKYEGILTKDPDVAAFVRALMTYCKAFSCFNALLLIAKGTFADLGSEYNEDDAEADRKIGSQMQDLKDKLSFLFGEKYLTFLGRLPSEGGKLTKIVAFSRNGEARRIVKMTTRGFGFPEILDYEVIESKAEIVSRQSVTLKLEGHPNIFDFSQINGRIGVMQFINETQYPMKVIGGAYPEGVKGKFKQVLQPQSSSDVDIRDPSAGGYVLIYLDGKILPDDEPDSADKTRVIEFAYYLPGFGKPGINIQDTTCGEFTRGEDTYTKVNGKRQKDVYWKTKEVHYMASAEVQSKPIGLRPTRTILRWRYVFQDFDPSIDIITAPKDTGSCIVL